MTRKANHSEWTPPEIPPDISREGFYIGTSGYYFEDWLGLFNPPKITGKALASLPEEQKADQDRLTFYQKYFQFVEINNTFYREPMLQSFVDIERRSNENTLFSVKVNKDISHTRHPDPEKGMDLMKKHVMAVSPLIETGRFYSFLIQLEDHVFRTQKQLDYLIKVTSVAVKKRSDVHIEFRHNSWHHEHVLQSLKDNGIGVCNTEIPPVKHAFPLKSYATTDKGYIRYSGLNLENWYPDKKLHSSKERIASRNARYNYLYTDQEVQDRAQGQIVLHKKTNSVAIAYNNHYQIKAILNAIYNIMLLKQRLGIE